MKPDGWEQFELKMLEIARTFAQLRQDEKDCTPPKVVAGDLRKLSNALACALKKIEALRLEHSPGASLLDKPYNWPVVNELQHGRSSQLTSGAFEIAPHGYPTSVIAGMRILQSNADQALSDMKLRRGNSAERKRHTARQERIALNLVFRYRGQFHHRAPVSATGPVVDLLSQMLEAAGEPSHQAADLLRAAIIKDKAAADLPSAKEARSSQRLK